MLSLCLVDLGLPNIPGEKMSEYQYYEFQAIDRPLNGKQMERLRAFSTRATITPTRFTNVYHWGNFKGDVSEWMKMYFDAFLYVANWGSRTLILRIPERLIELETMRRYCASGCFSYSCTGGNLLVWYDCGEVNDDWIDGEGWLSALIPIRADLMRGDYRALYLGWLLALQYGEVDDKAEEPPVPPGMGDLSASLNSLIDFFALAPDLIAAAMEGSPSEHCPLMSEEAMTAWVTRLPEAEKNTLLLEMLQGENLHLAAELRRRALQETPLRSVPETRSPRTAGAILERAEAIAAERRRKADEKRKRESIRREREQAEARKRHLESLAGNESALWDRIEAQVHTRQPRQYDLAIALLEDLKDLAMMQTSAEDFESRLRALCRRHERKGSFIEKIREKKFFT